MDVWRAIRPERAALVEALAMLPDRAWGGPSWCAGRTVKDTVAPPTAGSSTAGFGVAEAAVNTGGTP